MQNPRLISEKLVTHSANEALSCRLYAIRYPLEKDAGFTLLELIIVLFLASLMLGISTIFLANLLPSSRFDATVREISATIRHARSLAKITGENKTITIDLDARKYWIEGMDEKSIPSGINIKAKDSLSREITTGKYYLIFNASVGIEGRTITVWNEKKTVNLEVDPIVGAVIMK